MLGFLFGMKPLMRISKVPKRRKLNGAAIKWPSCFCLKLNFIEVVQQLRYYENYRTTTCGYCLPIYLDWFCVCHQFYGSLAKISSTRCHAPYWSRYRKVSFWSAQ